MRYFQHHIGDYTVATAHLSFVEDAAYHRCLRRYYQDEKPLPADLAVVARLVGARTKDERQAVANVLSEFFDLCEDGYHQKRADKEIAAYQKKAQTARDNGTNGGRPSKPRENQSGFPLDAEEEPDRGRPEKLTINHEPLTNNQSRESNAAKPHCLPPDWKPSDEGRAYALTRRLNPDRVAEAFVDYWTGGKGAKQRRTDWNRTWRVWCDRETPRAGGEPTVVRFNG